MKRRGLGAAATLALTLTAAAGLAAAQEPTSATAPAQAGQGDVQRILGLVQQGMDLDDADRFAEALIPLQEAYPILKAQAPVENRWRQNAAMSLAHALSELDREDEAVAILSAENDALIAAGQDAAPDAPGIAFALAMVLYNDNRYAEAGPPAQRTCDLWAMPVHGGDANKCRRLDMVRAAAGMDVQLTPEQAAELATTRDMDTVLAAFGRGDLAGTEDAFERLIGWLDKDEGADGETALMLKMQRARLFLGQGQAARAATEFAALHAAGLRMQGPAGTITLEALGHQAEALAAAGEPDQALAVLDAATPAIRQASGATGAVMTSVLTQRADALLAMGETEEAVAAYRGAVEAGAGLPATDPALLHATVSLGGGLNMAGRLADAKVLLRPLAQVQAEPGSAAESSINQARLLLAEVLVLEGDSAEAEALLEALLTVWGPDERKTMQMRAAALLDMALVRKRQGRVAEGERLSAEAAGILAERAPLSLVRLRAERLRGSLLVGLGRYAEAGEVLRDTVALEGRVLGEGHPESVITLMSLAESQFEGGQSEAGRATMTRAIDISERRNGPAHPATAGTYNQAALLEWNADDYAAAAPLIERAVQGYAASLGADNPQTVMSRVNRAAIWAELGRRQEALVEYQALLDLRRRRLGEDHVDVAHLLHTIALQMQPEVSPADAEAMLRQAADIGRARLEAGDPDRMLWETGLAWQLMQEDRPREALPLLRAVGVQATGRPGGMNLQALGQTESERLRQMFRGQVIAAWEVAHPQATGAGR